MDPELTCVALGAAALTFFSAFLKNAWTASAFGAGAAFMAVLAFKLAPRNSVRMANTMTEGFNPTSITTVAAAPLIWTA